MAYEFDEMNHRTRDRELARRHRLRMQRRRAILRWSAFGAIALVSLVMVIALVARGGNEPQGTEAATQATTTQPSTTVTTAPPTVSTAPLEPETVIRLVFGGDINVTDKLVAAGARDERYDYTHLLADILPVLSDADATFVNLEGGFYGPPYGSATCSAPEALAAALAAAGVDMVQMANSRTIAGGISGLSATVSTLQSHAMRALGVFPTEQEQQESEGYTLVNIGGIRVAIVAFTKGMDGMSLPAGSEGCVNLLYTDYATTYQTVDEAGITAVLEAVQAQAPDLTVAMVHWGSEYNDTISPTQQQIVTLMQGLGVDAIVGTHSHYVQKVVYDPEQSTVVAYSLGDLLGDGEKAGTNYSILLQLEVTRDNTTGETKITGCDYTGLYLMTPEKDGQEMALMRIQPAMEMFENNHISKVSQLTYDNLRYAWQRIQARAEG